MVKLNNLNTYKNEILKLEIISLFSLLEKTFTEWWKKKGFFQSYSEQFSDIENEYENLISSFKNITFNLDIKYDGNSVNSINAFNDFINSNWRSWRKIKLQNEPQRFLQVLYGSCEGINSGIEKGSPSENYQISKMSDKPYLSYSFGSKKVEVSDANLNELREILFSENLSDRLPDEFKRCLKNIRLLNKNINTILEELSNDNLSVLKIIEIRIRIFNLICLLYKNTPSDSRFPANDTSLFDQAYMSTSLFKAALSGILLNSANNEIDITNFNHRNIKWSILGIQYDKLGLAEKGLKVASIKWYRDTSYKVDNEIKKLIEIEYALGNEVYRDERGIYFVVAENVKGDKNGDFYDLNSGLDDIKSKIQEIFSDNFKGEVYPAILLTEPSRGLMNLGHLIEKAKENFLKAEYPEIFEEKLKHDAEPNGVCQICGMRLAHKGNKDNLICDVCNSRLKGRVEKWSEKPDKETIWLDELQDKNGRIALVTLKFELGKWLNGDLVNSLVVQNFDLSDKSYNDYFNDVLDGIKNNKKINNTILKDYHANIPKLSLRNLIEKWLLERSIGSKWEAFIINSLLNTSLINFENRTVNWNGFSENNYKFITALFLQFLLRKNPSPARLRRIWETTREFFENLESKLIDKLIILPEGRKKRIVITLKDGSKYKDKEYKYGELLFWKNGNEIRTITSIEKVANYIGKEFKIFGKSNLNEREENDIKDWLTNKIKKIESYYKNENDIIEFDTNNIGNIQIENYNPYFTILKPTSISWQFIIPAENLPQLIENVQKEYYKNFKWVYGKLPLHMGIIVQNYKKPLYVGIKALRKIRRDGVEWDKLGKKIPAKDFKARQKEVFHYQSNPENTEDCENFYSFFEKIENEGKYEFYLYPEKGEKVWLDTTKDVADTDKFKIYPNTVDFEFLDTNTRRNDIYYNEETGKRYLKTRQMRPYDLHDWQYFEKFKEFFLQDKKSSSKLQKLISLIYSKTEDWDDSESLKQFMLSAFVNVLELKDDKDQFAGILGFDKFKELKEISAGIFKEKLLALIDMFDFWHMLLKY